ncbi:hypothetical protein ATE92_1592 [Ulvibacter sp. MAR_2010_11]|uniref:hypothetical protein n=1 Tax=Ulvibacter sp. MAR_2010_11 TaxID=1250229 RepID=UPI000C2C4B1A|nr:hypothetical protein [Ulvibacter sp. MAR_2010_11]PKA83438.1 hypothetical protein ATE92_1592 [Ulvibacter sp. MAR_2010_11]
MKLLWGVFNFYIHSSIHVALAVLSLIFVTQIEFGFNHSFALSGFVFFGTITGYNFVKYAEVAGLHHRSLTSSLKSIQIFSLVCFGIFLFFAFKQSLAIILTSLSLGLITLLYAIPFRKQKNLRTFGGLKIFIVAMVWAGVTVLLPIVASEAQFEGNHLISFLQRFLFIIVLTLPFEIRDLPFDSEKLHTLPQLFGFRRVKVLGNVLLGICFLLEYAKDSNLQFYTLSLFAICVLTAVLLFYSEEKQSKYFASFWVEAVPVFWYGLLLLSIHFFT